MPKFPDRILHATAIVLATLLLGAASAQHDNTTPSTTKSAPTTATSPAPATGHTGTTGNTPGFVMSHDVCAKHPNLKQCS